MAFMNKERKAERAPAIKSILKKYGVKGSIGVCNYSSLVVNIKSGKLDFIGMANARARKYAELHDTPVHLVNGSYQVNPYYEAEGAREVGYDSIATFIEELTAAMYGTDYFDESDSQTDYFHCSHYIDINIGKWDKPYTLTA